MRICRKLIEIWVLQLGGFTWKCVSCVAALESLYLYWATCISLVARVFHV